MPSVAEKPKRTRKAVVKRPPPKLKPKPKGGRPTWEPRRKLVEKRPGVFAEQTREQAWEDARSMVLHYSGVMQWPAERVAKHMDPPCAIHTLEKYFKPELEHARDVKLARLAAVAWSMGTSGRDATMTRFLCRTQLGWKDQGDAPAGGSVIVIGNRLPGDDDL